MAAEEANDLRREHMRMEVDDGEHERVDRYPEGLRTGQARAGMQIGIRVTPEHM